MSRIFLFICFVALIILPVSYGTLQAQTQRPGIQGNPEPTPYYDPRYTSGNVSQNNPRNVRAESALHANEDPTLTQNQNRELPKTAGQESFLAVIGILSIVGSASLRMATYSSRG